MANDLDLDELHEAVSALMDQSKNKRAERPSQISEPRPVDPPAEHVPVKSANSAEPLTSPEPNEDKIEVKRPLPNIAVGRPRGRAMDVISPKPAAPAPVATKVNRTGVTLQPTASVEPEPVKVEEKPVETLPKDEPERPALNYQKPVEDSWPDPLDMHGFKGEEPKPEAAPTMTETPDAKTEPATLTSPFLNTKVEKRPLGAYAAEEPEAPEQTPKPAPVEDEMSLNSAMSQQPKELSPEVVAVESAEPEQSADFAFEDESQDTRQATIPQQYQAVQKESNKDERPVFDTKDYHPPIAAHAAQRSSSAMGWVLIIVFALILIGALLFAFYMMTGGLDFSVLFS